MCPSLWGWGSPAPALRRVLTCAGTQSVCLWGAWGESFLFNNLSQNLGLLFTHQPFRIRDQVREWTRTDLWVVQAGWFRCPCAPPWPRPGFVSRSLLHTHSLGGAFIYCHSLLSPTLQWRVFSGLIAFFGKGECLFPTVWAAIWICLLMGGGRGHALEGSSWLEL